MADDRTFVIVGAGLAGGKAAETLRDEGFEGRVVLLGEEPDRPYERPPLSKEYLRGHEDGTADVPWVHDEGWYAEHDVDLRVGVQAQSLDIGARTVTASDGETLRYDALLLATGSVPRRPDVPGADLDQVVTLRRRSEADALRARFATVSSVVVVGGGWIGCEVAASARVSGPEVTLLDRGSVPLEHVVGREVGAVFRDAHVEHGVQVLSDTRVAAFEGGGAVEVVRLEGGERVPAEVVVVGVGVLPRTELAARAGLAIHGGVAVDEHLRTAADGVFAAGDCAAALHPVLGRRLHVEHWANALHQGPVAARSMLGGDAVYDRLPYVFSDQYDLGMEYVGDARGDDRVVFRGDPLAGEGFVALFLRDDRVLAGMHVNTWDTIDDLRALVLADRPVDEARLVDPDVPLADLAR